MVVGRENCVSRLNPLGDWRPHFREYSRSDLFQLLEWAGFEVVEHNFYETKFGEYTNVNGKLLREKKKSSLKSKLKSIIREQLLKFIPRCVIITL